MAEKFAKELRKLMSAGEGPSVEDGMYNYACHEPSQSRMVKASSWAEVLAAYHQAGVDDQFIPPLVRVDDKGKPVGVVKDNDVVVYFDFRTDRAKPLTAAFLDIPFEGQVGGLSEDAKAKPKLHSFVTMTHYDDNFSKSSLLHEAFNPSEPLSDTYAEVVGVQGVKQLICAESEKWRAVTWFKDGRRNLGYAKSSEEGNVRVDKHPRLPITVKIVSSRKVAAHIQAPEMRAKEICELLVQGVEEGVEDIFANFANADMVGHAMTDEKNIDGVVAGILELNTQLGRLVPLALKNGFAFLKFSASFYGIVHV